MSIHFSCSYGILLAQEKETEHLSCRISFAIDWRQVEKKLGKMKKARDKEKELEVASTDMKVFKQLSLEEKRAVR